MKSSEEMVNSLLERRKHYIARQKQRRTAVVRAITCMCCVCFMAILSFGVYRAVFFNIQEPSTTISADANETVDRPSSDDLNDVLNYVIIWDDNICDDNICDDNICDDNGDVAADSAFENLNGKKITISLANALRNAPENSKIAIIAYPVTIDNTFVFNGKSIAEYQEEIERKKDLTNRLAELLNTGESLKYGETLYQNGSPEGEKWAQSLYEETIEIIGDDLLSKYIVDGIFLKADLETDIVGHQEKLTAAHKNYDFACIAYRKHTAGELKRQLGTHDIDYDGIANDDRDYVIIYASAKQFSDLFFEGITNWHFDFASKNDLETENLLSDQGYENKELDVSN